MENFKKYLGVILVLLGVCCLGVYEFVPSNILLICAMVLELAGILAYILLNRRAN